MNHGLTVYAVDTEHLESIYGCKDENLILAVHKHYHKNNHQQTKYSQQQIKTLQAFTDIVNGTTLNQHYSVVYAAAIQLYCEVFKSEILENAPFHPCSHTWLQEIDTTLEEIGISQAFRLSKLISGKLPLPVPHHNRLCQFGHVSTAAVYQAFSQLRHEDYMSADNSMIEAIACVKKWLRYVSSAFEAGSHLDLVGFYY
ncbi:MAG: hypothetical protein AAF208_01040 [Cyanobacteria bacterium P01_A01_bin.45]